MADATATLQQITTSLDQLSNKILVTMGAHQASFMEHWGWNMPGLTGQDLADYIRTPIRIINRIDGTSFTDADVGRLTEFPRRIQFLIGNVLPNLPSGNASNSWTAISGVIIAITQILDRYGDVISTPEQLAQVKSLPREQLIELRKIERRISNLRDASGDLDVKVEKINSAFSVAEGLPEQLQALDDAIQSYAHGDEELAKTKAGIVAALDEAKQYIVSLEKWENQAQMIVTKANTAYSAATTQGLGKAFADRASVLTQTTMWLGAVLILTLLAGGSITYQRVDFVHKLMMQPNVSYGILWLNVTFTVLSVSGPVWLAWLLTRQIGQRFRLAEDYGYKAAVAKAYEGYRAEAAEIDPQLAKKLFSIALDMLAEPPLRLVEKDSPGSPMHDARGGVTKLLGPISGRKNNSPSSPSPQPVEDGTTPDN